MTFAQGIVPFTWAQFVEFTKVWAPWIIMMGALLTLIFKPFKKRAESVRTRFCGWLKRVWEGRRSNRNDILLDKLVGGYEITHEELRTMQASIAEISGKYDGVLVQTNFILARLDQMDESREKAVRTQYKRDEFCNYNERDRHEAQIAMCSGFYQLGAKLGVTINGPVAALMKSSQAELDRLRNILADQHRKLVEDAAEETISMEAKDSE